METKMNTLTKTLVGAALIAGSVLAVSAPASAQPAYRGDGVYGRSYDGYGYGRYDNRYYGSGPIWRDTRHCTSPRFGRWRRDTLTNRRVFVPYRWAVRGGYLSNCMYTQSRSGGVWYRY
jgi:hypothetical protein